MNVHRNRRYIYRERDEKCYVNVIDSIKEIWSKIVGDVENATITRNLAKGGLRG